MKILAFGEVNMRLTPPEYKLLEQTNQLDFSFTGTGLNLLSGLFQFGYDTKLFTTLPNNRVGKAASSYIRKLGVDDSTILYKGNHIGSYFAELGFGKRPTQVTYMNRSESAFCTTLIEDETIDDVLSDIDFIHICGIALSTSHISRINALKIARIAHKRNIQLCFDFNYRPSLNKDTNQDELVHAYKEILKYSSIVFGSEKDLSVFLQLKREEGASKEAFFQLFLKTYNIDVFSGTLKRTVDNKKEIKGYLATKQGCEESSWRKVDVLDRIGAGDAYAAGVITGLLSDWTAKKTVEFATATSQLSYTTYGDSSILEKDFVLRVLEQPDQDIFR